MNGWFDSFEVKDQLSQLYSIRFNSIDSFDFVVQLNQLSHLCQLISVEPSEMVWLDWHLCSSESIESIVSIDLCWANGDGLTRLTTQFNWFNLVNRVNWSLLKGWFDWFLVKDQLSQFYSIRFGSIDSFDFVVQLSQFI